MELAQTGGAERSTPDGDQPGRSHDRSRESATGVTYERLRPTAPDFVLPATFLAVTVLGILFVLVVLIIWLRANFTSSSSKRERDGPSQSAAKECRLLRIMEPDSARSKLKIVVDSDRVDDSEVDDFEFKLPSVLNDSTDFKYIDESDGGRNTSPPISKMNTNGGSSPKLPESDASEGNESGGSGDSTPNVPSEGKAIESRFAFPDESRPESGRETSEGSGENKFGKMKVAVADRQWIVHRKPPLNWRGYDVDMPKAFSFGDSEIYKNVSSDEGTSRKYSATRSPSLEKDDYSPSAFKIESFPDRVFEGEGDSTNANRRFESGGGSPVVEVRVQPLATDCRRAVFGDGADDVDSVKTKSVQKQSYDSKSISDNAFSVRKLGTINAGLRICTKNDIVNPNFNTEKIEMQNSPRLADSISGKENNPSPRFNFSPSFFASPDSKSPKFFSSVEVKSPKYFSENQSKNASPKLSGAEKPSSPRFAYTNFKVTQSPLIVDRGNGNYFSFENEESNDYNDYKTSGDNNNKFDNLFDRETNISTDLEESSVRKKKTDSIKFPSGYDSKHDLVSTTGGDNLDANVNINIIPRPESDDCVEIIENTIKTDSETNNISNEQISHSQSCSGNIASNFSDNICEETMCHNEVIISSFDDTTDNLSIAHPVGSSANYRRQRLKSISLDSDNAKFIEQNLGIPMVKHLKHENLYDSCETDNLMLSSNEENQPSNNKVTYFNFSDNENQNYTSYTSSDDTLDDYRHPVEISTIDPGSNFFGDNTPAIAFSEMQPRFSPKEFEVIVDESAIKGNKNIRNLTIDLNKHDAELEKELSEFDCLESGEKRVTPKTPTLKIKATSLDSSETLNLSLPQSNTLQVPQNSISVPNTPKRQLKRALTQKSGKLVKASHYIPGNYSGNLNEVVPRIYQENQQGRKIYMNVKYPSNFIDSGIFLRENHANLMLFQAQKYPVSRGLNTNTANFARRMGSFDENMVDYANQHVASQPMDNRLTILQKPCDSNMLGSNLLSFKQTLSVSSTNLKTLPEGVPSNDFEIEPEEKSSKKTLLQRRGSNQSLTINLETSASNLKYSALSLQGSNLSLASFGASSHNLSNIKNSASNFSLNTDNRQKKNILERRNSNTSLTLNLDHPSQHGRLYSSSHCNLQGSHYSLTNQETHGSGHVKKCLLQRRGSNTSLTLNLQNSNLSRCTSNSSLNIHNEVKIGEKKGLLERRSSNTSLTLNIGGSNSQFDNNRVLSISNYNLEGAGNTLSRYNSNQSINNSAEHKKGLLERRSSNTSLTLNIATSNYNIQESDMPRNIDIDDSVLQTNLQNTYKEEESCHQKEKHRKSLSTENLFSKSYRSKMFHCKNVDNVYSFGSHDNLWSTYRPSDSMENIDSGVQNLTYICGDQENEIIYAFGDRQHLENAGFPASNIVKNITTKPLSPHSTSTDFKLYLANIHHLQTASNVLSRQQLKDLNSVFQDGYSKTECPLLVKKINIADQSIMENIQLQIKNMTMDGNNSHAYESELEHHPQRLLPEPVFPCAEYQKSLLRNLHQEFWDLPTNFQEKPMVFGSHPKNRYKTILPNEHSRVILRAEPGEVDEGYVNANYIKGHEFTKNSYIATQGPLQNTIYDFWLMVYQNGCQFHKDGCTKTNEERHFGSPQARVKHQQEYMPKKFRDNKEVSIQKIVMLTNLLENGRQKCEKYFPIELHEEMVFKKIVNSSYSSCGGGSFFSDVSSVEQSSSENIEEYNTFMVKNIGIINKTGYTIRKLYVEYRNKHLKENSSVLYNVIDKAESVDVPESFKVSITCPEESAVHLQDLKTDYLIVYHYWFENWADHKCPKDVTALLELSLDVLKNQVIDFDDGSKQVISSQSKIDSDIESASRERRLSAFQSAKAFFDEFSKQHSQDDRFKKPAERKNSLASKLDLPKPKYDLQRRESTGAIDSSKAVGVRLFGDSQVESARRRKSADLNIKSSKATKLIEMPPVIVHCSAGIGRTGCLIAVLNGIKQLKIDEKVDILGIVCNMRLNRGGMVQNSEQYELIHKVLCLYNDLGLPDVD